MGDGGKHKSPKSAKGKLGVMKSLGDVVQTFSPRNYRNKMKRKSLGNSTANEEGDEKAQVKSEGLTSPTNVGDLTGIAAKAEPSKDVSDEKSAEFKFFYEGGDSGEFSSPFTSQFQEH
ncbi:MAG: hypothetical protein SGBAC_007184 [Bacillariaceae sp.]